MIADFTSTTKLPPQQGLAYTMLSRATSRASIKTINFKSNDIKVNKQAIDEINRMNRESLFEWKHPLSQLNPNNLSIGHVNIRLLNLHAKELKHDQPILNLSIICVTETYGNYLSHLHRIDNFNFLGKPTPHGVGFYISKQVQVTEYSLPYEIIDIEYHTIKLDYNHKPLILVVIYKSHSQHLTDFISQFDTLVSGIKVPITLLL
ncbi:hypothetical protein SNE40_002949 [Patella caerulea]|uniref:Uncharacterized protein n=1 Tax=Patella caerulea TaxID=87958 RepID=A0AAN8QEN0_PATCE